MNVVFLGCTLNYGRDHNASNTKVKLICDSLTKAGAKCFIHAGLLGTNTIKIDTETIVDDIPCTEYARLGGVGLGELKNYKKLVCYLENHKSNDGYNIGIVELPMLHTYLMYCRALRKCGFKILVISHEWGPTLNTAGLQKVSNNLYSKIFGFFVDGILPISEFIIDKIKHFNKPYLKVPALADFDSFDRIESHSDNNYFLYCASAKYFRILSWLIDSFNEYLHLGGSYNMKMILSGNERDLHAVKVYLNEKGITDQCLILSHVSYETLQSYYKGAAALLIPLDPYTIQDTARFPQKIAEYTASRRPMITSFVGEVKIYFDEASSFLSKYDCKSYAQTMIKVERDPDLANRIANAAYSIGLDNFDIASFGIKLYEFFKSV